MRAVKDARPYGHAPTPPAQKKKQVSADTCFPLFSHASVDGFSLGSGSTTIPPNRSGRLI